MTHDDETIPNIEVIIGKINSTDFDRFSSHCFSSAIPSKCLEGPCILGVDEAGRGPVLGPMVYAVCYCPIKQVSILKNIGCADSKALTEKKREEVFVLLNNHKEDIGWSADVISPNLISNGMQKRIRYSLNEIAQNSTINLIQSLLERNVQIHEIYVDTIGPPEKYQEKLSRLFPQCKIVVEKKADALYPIVSGASICAKVIRDTVVQNWKFSELINMEKHDFGTGYPNDPKTKEYLKNNRDEIFGFPQLVRFSWSTVSKILEEGIAVEWENEGDGNVPENSKEIASYFKLIEPLNPVKHKNNFFKERSLCPMENL